MGVQIVAAEFADLSTIWLAEQLAGLIGGFSRRRGTEMEPPRSLRSLPPEGALSTFGTAGRY